MANPATTKKTSPEEKAVKVGDQVLALDVKRVADWIQALVRTLKAYRMYLPNNPTLHKFQSDLEARTWSCLKEIGDIVLNVQQFDLLFEDYSVYHNAAREESLAFRFFTDGVRQITFREGLEPQELRGFLEVLKKATDQTQGQDDVVTLLGDFLDHLGTGPVLLLGHSYGAYLARGLAARRPDLVLGLALLCPVAEQSGKVPEHDVVVTSDCNGPVRTGRFHFDAFDFQSNCGGEILSGCTTTEGNGVQTSGDLEFLHMAIGPGDAQHGDKVRRALLRRERVALAQHAFDLFHRQMEILARTRPARRIDARCPVERIDHEPGIIRQCRHPGHLRCGFRLDAGIRREGRAGFLRLGEVQLAGRHRFDAVETEQLAHLGEFAGIVRGDNDAAGERAMHCAAIQPQASAGRPACRCLCGQAPAAQAADPR